MQHLVDHSAVKHERVLSRTTPFTVFPKCTASTAVSAPAYTPDWTSQCREQLAYRHPPAVYGSGAAAAVLPRGLCCLTRPFSSLGRSRRPWSDFLRGSLTFCRGVAAGGDAVSVGPLAGAGWASLRALESTRLGRARDHSAAPLMIGCVTKACGVMLIASQSKANAPSAQGCRLCAVEV